ncbi:fumarylacetoacetate hydrolase family protein [Variovorax sp. HJSM1_2]|uniref:fumarylacetoacetate hydrolase family protein n=1 Tax=Variovorax sp. HJSM1_2 TaxID=3366263 RepID=UPI003BD43C69
MEKSVLSLALALAAARRSHTAVDAAGWEVAVPDIGTAYAVQDAVAATLGWFPGPAPTHWKGGAPNTGSPASYAPLPSEGVQTSPAVRPWSGHFLHTFEAEVAVRVGTSLSATQAASISVANLADVLDGMAVSIELVDSRWQQGTDVAPLLRTADMQVHGALTLGAWQAFTARSASDWAAQTCEVYVDGKPHGDQRSYTGSHPTGDPLWVVPLWLRHVAERHGTVPAGSILTTGSWCGLLRLSAPGTVRTVFPGIGEASLTLN